MSEDPNSCEELGINEIIAYQREHWGTTFSANPEMYGNQPSEPGCFAAQRFTAEGMLRVLELGAGQGRDTLNFLRSGLLVTALDYAENSIMSIAQGAANESSSRDLTTVTHDVREPLPFPNDSFDGCYSHMLFTMALTTSELVELADEIHRVVRPGGLCVYTVRHTGDAHYGAGRNLGDNLYENGGFAVHFFDRQLVKKLAKGFEVEDIVAFEEGDLPRRLWRVTMRRL